MVLPSHIPPGRVRRCEAPTTFQAQVVFYIPDLICSPPIPERGVFIRCYTEEEMKETHILFSHLLPATTHTQTPARVTRPVSSQPVESRWLLFMASPRENLFSAEACPILPSSPSPLPSFLLLDISFARKSQGSGTRPSGPAAQARTHASSPPSWEARWLTVSGTMKALCRGQLKVLLSLPLPPALAQIAGAHPGACHPACEEVITGSPFRAGPMSQGSTSILLV